MQNRHYGHRNREQTPRLDSALVTFYAGGGIDPQLLNTKAEQIADVLSKAGRDTNSYTQLRRFYDEVNDFYEEIKTDSDFEDRLPLILMLNSKVAYAKGRNKVDDNFVSFIKAGLAQVKNKEDFRVFKLLFEAVMGFLRAKKNK